MAVATGKLDAEGAKHICGQACATAFWMKFLSLPFIKREVDKQDTPNDSAGAKS
jgi:hypothetical protein